MNDMDSCFIDAHLHLQDDHFSGKAGFLIENAKKAGVAVLLCNAVKEPDWPVIVELGKNYDSVIPFLGIHPWNAGSAAPGWESRLIDILGSLNQGSGIGESGLDKTCSADFRLQLKMFETHLEIAYSLSLPIALHCVRGWGIFVDILESYSRRNRLPATMVHSFSGSYETMKRLTDIGCFISYSLNIMDPRWKKMGEVFTRTPLAQLLLETDAPGQLLSPPGFNTRETVTTFSEPILIPDFYRWAAQQKNNELSHFKTQIWRNGQIYSNQTFAG